MSERDPSGGSTDGILRANEVTKRFGDVTVVDAVSLGLDSGRLYALVGPNGSGKTTLLRLLAGIDPPTAGSVSYDGPDAVRQVGYLPQRPAFRPGFTAAETLEFYTALVDSDPSELLSRVGLTDAADRRVESLSGGMTRLLGLAQATIGDPPVVILDEPGSGLGPKVRRRMIELAQSLADRGQTVVYSSHDLELVEQYAGRVCLLDSGSVIATGSPQAVREEFGEETLWDVFESTVAGVGDQLDVVGVTGRD